VWSNFGDVWDIPNVKAKHVEKTEHPCQFPVSIPRRLIKALTNKGAVVLDPYLGSGSTAVAALLEDRQFKGSDLEARYLKIASKRVKQAAKDVALVRPDAPPRVPQPGEAVSKLPKQFRAARRKRNGKRTI
jgi:adenine-specific DNA-methyltransferase